MSQLALDTGLEPIELLGLRSCAAGRARRRRDVVRQPAVEGLNRFVGLAEALQHGVEAASQSPDLVIASGRDATLQVVLFYLAHGQREPDTGLATRLG